MSDPLPPSPPANVRDSAIFTALLAAGAALCGVVLSGLVAWGVADQTSDAALETQAEQIQAEREDRDRDRRASVYEEFVNAANNFAFDAALARDTCGGPNLRRGDLEEGDRCDVNWEEAIRSRVRLQAAINDVYTYGTERAREAQRKVSATLPPTLLSDMLGREASDPIIYGPAIDSTAFREAYNEFLEVMCGELPYSGPREGCDTN